MASQLLFDSFYSLDSNENFCLSCKLIQQFYEAFLYFWQASLWLYGLIGSPIQLQDIAHDFDIYRKEKDQKN